MVNGVVKPRFADVCLHIDILIKKSMISSNNKTISIYIDVDCGRPPVIPNGRGYLVNGTTFYGSIVEYHCLADYRMISESQHRVCQANGEWLV